MSMDFWHALVTGVLIAMVYGVMENMGFLHGKSLGKKMLILMPVYFVLILILNLLWPGKV